MATKNDYMSQDERWLDAIYYMKVAVGAVVRNWQWPVALAAGVIVWTGVIAPEVPQFKSMVMAEEGHTAIGQRVFGSRSDRQ